MCFVLQITETVGLSIYFSNHFPDTVDVKNALFQQQQTELICLLDGSRGPGSVSFVLYFPFKKRNVMLPFQTTCKSYPVGAGKCRERHTAAGR